MKRRLFLGLGAATAFGAGVPAFADGHAAAEAETPTPTPAPAGLPLLDDVVMGAEDAPVTIYEYSSFTCPHCKTFHLEVLPQFKADYIDTGKVRLVYREAYFDRPGLWAALVARCGGDMRYFGIVDMLFQKQRDWIGDGQGPTIAANLRGIGKAAGLTDADLDTCLSDGASAQALIARYEESMKEYDITGTPTVVVNGEKVSPLSYKSLSEAVDAALEG